MARLLVNGKPYTVDVAPDSPLLWVIREVRQVPMLPDRVLKAIPQKA